MSDWVKAILIKLWIAGMICYFFIWGISTIAINPWDQLLVIGITLGLATNLMTNNIYRFIAKTPGAYDRWMMFPGKKLYFLPLDVVYAILLTACTIMTYNGINLLAAGGAYTDSTFWFDIHYVVCILAVAAAVLLIVNFIWKKRMMRGEKELLASSGKAVSA